ncbi:MAG: TIGR03571 family LLM class oxidoreductase [Capnocytophaga sp.]|nr:TIGR03571 family LLM class oxidoreductase [Capnocytophaga sp.]
MKTALPTHLAQHKGFSQVFKKGELTFGLIAPFKGYADSHSPDMSDFIELAKIADQSIFSALWLRDVPFYDPNFGDVGQIYDPFVVAGLLSAVTQRITIGTAGIVAPLREPIHTAKGATSVDNLSGGRFLLGLSSGDRPVEYPAFNSNFDNRAERFREIFGIIDTLTQRHFPVAKTEHYGDFVGNIDLIPKPLGALPKIAIGRARQEMCWLANVPDAWIWHGVNPNDTAKIIKELEDLGDGTTWKPFGYANFVEVLEDRNAPAQLFNNILLRGGVKGLADFWAKQKEQGLAHITLNLKPTRRPATETLLELSESLAKI